MKPNLFIVGVPKAATTSLYDYLLQHPDVCMAKQKEPYFFAKDFQKESDKFHGKKKFLLYRTEKEYLELFSHCKSEIRGEASTTYMYSKVAAKEIKKFNPEAKIIVILRNPVDFLHSLHSHFCATANENETDFEMALALEKKRKAGRNIPSSVLFPSFLYYSEVAKFSEQVKRYKDNFPRNQIKIIIFEDFIKNTEKIYKDILKFLDLDTSFKPEFNIKNPNKQVKYLMFRKFVRNLNYKVKRICKQTPFIYRFYKILDKINTSFEKRKPMDPALRKKLMKKFKPEVKKLSKILKKDFIKKWNY